MMIWLPTKSDGDVLVNKAHIVSITWVQELGISIVRLVGQHHLQVTKPPRAILELMVQP